MPTMQPSVNYVVGEVQDVTLANGDTVKAVVPTVNVQPSPGSGVATEAKQDEQIALATGPSTGTLSVVASSATPVLILAGSADRKGAIITNTDENALHLLLASGVVSTTNFTVLIASNGSYEVPFGFTGSIAGIWAADGAGSAMVTEFT